MPLPQHHTRERDWGRNSKQNKRTHHISLLLFSVLFICENRSQEKRKTGALSLSDICRQLSDIRIGFFLCHPFSGNSTTYGKHQYPKRTSGWKFTALTRKKWYILPISSISWSGNRKDSPPPTWLIILSIYTHTSIYTGTHTYTYWPTHAYICTCII